VYPLSAARTAPALPYAILADNNGSGNAQTLVIYSAGGGTIRCPRHYECDGRL